MEQIINLLAEIKNEIKNSSLQQKEIYSLIEFCKYADISLNHGYKLTRENKIKFYRPNGKKIYIHHDDAIAFLMQNPISSTTEVNSNASNYFLTSKTSA